MSQRLRLGLILGTASVALSWAGWLAHRTLYVPPANSPEGRVSFRVEPGDSFRGVARDLQSRDILRPHFNLASKLLPTETLHPGDYSLRLPAPMVAIVEQINAQARDHGRTLMENQPESISVTVQEGLSVPEIAEKLVEAGVLSTTEEFFEVVREPGLFEYEFLPSPLGCTYGDRLDCVAYYLEGYLYPDTYEFFEDSDARDVVTKMLENFQDKVWSEYAGKVEKERFTKAVTMASVIEVETGRPGGVTPDTAEIVQRERRLVASVFYNRMDVGMEWKSDPTVSYDLPGKTCQQTVELAGCVYLNDARARTRYNTYRNFGYPVGPVSNPSRSSIEAALNPEESEYLFFVADNAGQTTFARTGEEHFENIDTIQQNSDE